VLPLADIDDAVGVIADISSISIYFDVTFDVRPLGAMIAAASESASEPRRRQRQDSAAHSPNYLFISAH
jgi:hypothetical protein